MSDPNANTTSVRADSVPNSLGKLILRCSIGALMLFHGVAKLQNGIGSIEGMVEGQGLPTYFAYGVYVGEVVAPLLLMLGLLTRIAGLIFAFNMGVAIALAHSGDVFALGEHGGWAIELQMLFLLGAVAVVFLGPGRFAIRPVTGVWA